MLKYLGKIGKDLPELSEKEWKVIFEFLEYFLVVDVEDFDRHQELINFNWKKVKDVLQLLGKMN